MSYILNIVILLLQDLPGPGPAKKRIRKQSKVPGNSKGKESFVDAWLKLPEFAKWLEKRLDRDYGGSKAYCTVCDYSLSNHKSVLRSHIDSDCHKIRMPLYDEIMRQREQLASYVGFAKKEDVAKYEMRILTLFAENRLPTSLADKLIPVLRVLHPEHEVLKKVQLGRTKAGDLIRDGSLYLNGKMC